MRLLNTTTLQLEYFVTGYSPYAILSHRWEEQEVTFQDLADHGKAQAMKGYNKLRKASEQALMDGLEYIWIDSCCIDKTSSAELSEVINSMFRYYKDAAVCYVYLFDVMVTDLSKEGAMKSFRESTWFTRGWTLQELIAPKTLHFYNAEWSLLGSKADLNSEIQAITSIDESTLIGGDLNSISACRKMSWVAYRQTTVPEDIAYCLLGVFDINMPLVYGEGQERAFQRLQEEILRRTEDESLFLWELPFSEARKRPFWGLLAKSPSCFKGNHKAVSPCLPSVAKSQPPVMTGRGLSTEMLLTPIGAGRWRSLYLALINIQCSGKGYGLLLQRLAFRDSQFARVAPDVIIAVDKDFTPDYDNLHRHLRSSKFPHERFLEERLDLTCSPEAFFVRQDPPLKQMWTTRVVGFILASENVPQDVKILDTSSRWVQYSGRMGPQHYRYALKLNSEELQGSYGVIWFGAIRIELLTPKSQRIMVLIGQGGGTTALGTSVWPSHPVIVSVPISSPKGDEKAKDLTFLREGMVDNAEAVMRACSAVTVEGTMSEETENFEVYGAKQSDASFETDDWRGSVYYSVKLGFHLDQFHRPS